MQINMDYNTGRYTVRFSEVGRIVVAVPLAPEDATPEEAAAGIRQREVTVESSVIVTPRRMIMDWPPQAPEQLRADHFAELVDMAPEVVVLGTGARIRFPDPAHTAPLLNAGIGVEVMDTAAACRTYNFLMADGRDVAAALMMI